MEAGANREPLGACALRHTRWLLHLMSLALIQEAAA